jgi:DNA-binding transcriptional regulator YiaG
MSTSEEIKVHRAALGLTWMQFAEKLGVSWRAVAHWEAGTRKPSRPAMILIEKLLSEHAKS